MWVRRVYHTHMKLAGFLLLLAGWAIVLTAVALLKTVPAQGGFVLAGAGVEAMGLTLAFRSHMTHRVEKDRGERE